MLKYIYIFTAIVDPFLAIPETPCGSTIYEDSQLRLPLNPSTQLYDPDFVSIVFFNFIF